MSATTSPKATIFAKSCSRRRRRSDTYLTEGPNLLVSIVGSPQRRDDVALEVRHVAGYKACLPGSARHDAQLPHGGRQHAGLGAREPLGSSFVHDLDRLPHVREGEEALRV